MIPNPWDGGTARMFASLGFRALATTSSGMAFTLGRPDGAVTLAEVADHVRLLDRACDLPVAVDLENGHGSEPQHAAAAITVAADAGAVGGSIEDWDPAGYLYEPERAAERVAAAAEAARALPFPFTLTARAENHIRGNPDLDDTIARLRAYEEAGADVLFAPGCPTEAIAAVTAAVGRPVTSSLGPGSDGRDRGRRRPARERRRLAGLGRSRRGRQGGHPHPRHGRLRRAGRRRPRGATGSRLRDSRDGELSGGGQGGDGHGRGTGHRLRHRAGAGDAGAVVVVVDLEQGAAEDAAERLGPEATGLACDVTDPGALRSVVAATVERHGRLDVVVANAGIASRTATVSAVSGEAALRVMDVNLLGVWHTVNAALPEIVRNRGHVVVISSVYAFVNGVGTAPYAMAKAGVEQLGRALRVELAQHGAGASVAYFGFIDTEMVHRSIDQDPLADLLWDNARRCCRSACRPPRPARGSWTGSRSARRASSARAAGWCSPGCGGSSTRCWTRR